MALAKTPPLLGLIKRITKSLTEKQKCYAYQFLVLLLTFLSYATYHMNRRAFPVVKSVLSPDCNTTKKSCEPWAPFQGSPKDDKLLGFLDFTFTSTYALFIFIHGYIAQRMDQRLFLSFGMILASVSTSLFGLVRPLAIHSLPYMFAVQFVNGVTQSTGISSVTEIVGVWISKRNPGVIFGVWCMHQFLGNITGNIVCGSFLDSDWSFSFFVPALIMLFLAIVNFCFLPAHPALLDINIDNNQQQKENENEAKPTISGDDNYEMSRGIGFCEALKLPGVVEFCVCVFFTKFIVYTLFFWLPYILDDILHNPEESADLSSLNDIGSCIGGLLAGILYDLTDSPGITCVLFLVSGVPTIYILFLKGISATAFVAMSFFAGCFFGGTFTLITSALTKRPSSSKQVGLNVRSIATLAAIYDGSGSLGASIGPLLTGFVRADSRSWQNESYMLTACGVFSALALSRQFYKDVLLMKSKVSEINLENDGGVSENQFLLCNKDDESTH